MWCVCQCVPRVEIWAVCVCCLCLLLSLMRCSRTLSVYLPSWSDWDILLGLRPWEKCDSRAREKDLPTSDGKTNENSRLQRSSCAAYNDCCVCCTCFSTLFFTEEWKTCEKGQKCDSTPPKKWTVSENACFSLRNWCSDAWYHFFLHSLSSLLHKAVMSEAVILSEKCYSRSLGKWSPVFHVTENSQVPRNLYRRAGTSLSLLCFTDILQSAST